MSTYYAHIAEDGRRQSIEDHLEGTAKLCADFADEFGDREQGRFIGLLHDIGKYSNEFQNRIINNGPKVDHSTAGALESANVDASWGAFCIAGHHSGIPDAGSYLDCPGDSTLYGRLKKGLSHAIPEYKQNWNGAVDAVSQPAELCKKPLSDSFIIRMLYSCLVDADYLDTELFMKNGKSLRGEYDSLVTLKKRLEQYISSWEKPTNELNKLRSEILNDCIINSQGTKGLYSLTVPTGGGKTISSMAFALNHAIKNGMSRIIYVIPYTSIIEQNAERFREIFGEKNVIEHHSGILYDMEAGTNDESCRNALATENWDAPIIVTTAVQFFESLYANRSSKCRKLHSIANSVIIFDEAQMIPSAHLRPCVAAISELVMHFGATAVLCTATQPSLNDLFFEYTDGMSPKEIVPNTDELYSKLRRVSFRMAGKLSLSELADALSALPQVLCIVNTRKTAQKIFSALPSEGSYHLSTLMYPAHRWEVLEEIRKRLKAKLPCRVVSTSLIEAGVDVDFPTVYRELAGLDSILQAAGRCNREGINSADDSIVTVFESESSAPQLIKVNIGATREVWQGDTDPSTPETISRYFSGYRSLIEKNADKYGVVRAFENGSFPFETIAGQFHLIDNATKTVYIPINDGVELTGRLKYGERSRQLYREAGRYSVNIYEQHYQTLLSSGDVFPLDEDSAVLENISLYDNKTGLSLSSDTGKCLFV